MKASNGIKADTADNVCHAKNEPENEKDVEILINIPTIR